MSNEYIDASELRLSIIQAFKIACPPVKAWELTRLQKNQLKDREIPIRFFELVFKSYPWTESAISCAFVDEALSFLKNPPQKLCAQQAAANAALDRAAELQDFKDAQIRNVSLAALFLIAAHCYPNYLIEAIIALMEFGQKSRMKGELIRLFNTAASA